MEGAKEETLMIGIEMHPEKLRKLKRDDIVVNNEDLVVRLLIGASS